VEAFSLPFRESDLEDNRLTFHIAMLAQPLPERVEPVDARRHGIWVKKADSRHLHRLRPGAERRGEPT
jgi:hypothetical protein